MQTQSIIIINYFCKYDFIQIKLYTFVVHLILNNIMAKAGYILKTVSYDGFATDVE